MADSSSASSSSSASASLDSKRRRISVQPTMEEKNHAIPAAVPAVPLPVYYDTPAFSSSASSSSDVEMFAQATAAAAAAAAAAAVASASSNFGMDLSSSSPMMASHMGAAAASSSSSVAVVAASPTRQASVHTAAASLLGLGLPLTRPIGPKTSACNIANGFTMDWQLDGTKGTIMPPEGQDEAEILKHPNKLAMIGRLRPVQGMGWRVKSIQSVEITLFQKDTLEQPKSCMHKHHPCSGVTKPKKMEGGKKLPIGEAKWFSDGQDLDLLTATEETDELGPHWKVELDPVYLQASSGNSQLRFFFKFTTIFIAIDEHNLEHQVVMDWTSFPFMSKSKPENDKRKREEESREQVIQRLENENQQLRMQVAQVAQFPRYVEENLALRTELQQVQQQSSSFERLYESTCAKLEAAIQERDSLQHQLHHRVHMNEDDIFGRASQDGPHSFSQDTILGGGSQPDIHPPLSFDSSQEPVQEPN